MKYIYLFLFICFLLFSGCHIGKIENVENVTFSKDANTLIASVERNLATMSASPPSDIDNDPRYSTADSTLDMLADLVNFYHFDLKRFKELDHSCFQNDAVSFYSFSVNCACTSPPVYSILVWETPSGPKARKWGWSERPQFVSEINKKNGLYLLVLSEKLSGSEYLNTAQVIQLSADTLFIEYQAFEEKARLSVTNGVFSYDTLNRILTCHCIDSANAFSLSMKFDGTRFQSE